MNNCKFCDIPKVEEFNETDTYAEGSIYSECVDEFWIKRYRLGNNYIVCAEKYGKEYEVSIDFCPWCGRKLD